MSYEVKLRYDPEWSALIWAKKHCPSYITNRAESLGFDSRIVYYFGEQKDANWFTLRWL